jgi:dTDP-4-dehydrorhamnose reductase
MSKQPIQVLVTGYPGQLAQALSHTQNMCDQLAVTYTSKEELDIANLYQAAVYLEANPIQYLINCAAYTQVDLAENNHAIVKHINATAPGYLAKLSNELGFTLLHISTDYVFEGNLAQPLTETMPTSPINYYGQTKLEGEQNILAYNATAYIIRTSWLYSLYGNNSLTRLLARTAQEKHINMVYDQVSSPTYAPDLAQAIWEIIILLDKKKGQYQPGIYHYANQGVASKYDFAWNVNNQVGIGGEIHAQLSKNLPSFAKRPAYTVLDTTKIQQTFELHIPHWQESLTRCLRGILIAPES